MFEDSNKQNPAGSIGSSERRGAVSSQASADIAKANNNGIHVDVAVNPFLSEKERQDILDGKIQDPEWD